MTSANHESTTNEKPRPSRLARFILAWGNLHRRALAVLFFCVGPRISYRMTGWGGALLYWLLIPLRERSEAQCRAALCNKLEEYDYATIAKQSFVHRSRNLTDLMLASRMLRPHTFEKYGGKLPEPFLSRMMAAQDEKRPMLLVTGYYGSFDMLPIFLGYNGIRATAVYRPHLNSGFDAYRKRIRAQSGCAMIPMHNATARIEALLEGGGSVALVADHHVETRGIDIEFLGIPTRAMAAVGLLACRHQAEVVVAGLHRVGADFRFEFIVQDTIVPNDWADESNPVESVTKRYMRGIEQLVLRDPTHYLWGYARWGEAHARKVAEHPNREG